MRVTERRYKQTLLAILLAVKEEYDYCTSIDDVIDEVETELAE